MDPTIEKIRKALRTVSPEDRIILNHAKIRGLERGIDIHKVSQNLQAPTKLKKAVPQPERGIERYLLIFEYTDEKEKIISTDIEEKRIIVVTLFLTKRGRYL